MSHPSTSATGDPGRGAAAAAGSADGAPDRMGHVVIVGAGECGARVAAELRTGGWCGSVTVIGDEQRATYERPPLSKSALLDEAPSPVEPYRRGGLEEVEIRSGRAVSAINTSQRTVSLDDGEQLAWDSLVLATGARSRRLPGAPDGVLTLRTWEESQALREVLDAGGRLLVVGAGLIGLEVAASACRRGLEVTVVEAGTRALGRAVPEGTAQTLVARHTAEGVRILTATTLASLAPGPPWRARLSNGEEVVADAVLAAIGSEPVVDLAVAAGIEVTDGIVVDEQMRTNAPDVWAAGDCCAGPVAMLGARMRLESWRMAHDQAVTVARSLLGDGVPHTAVPWFWSDQFDLTLQVSGLAEAASRWLRRERPDGLVVDLGLSDTGRLVAAAGVGRGGALARDVRAAERLIGARATPDPAALVDPAVPLRSLV